MSNNCKADKKVRFDVIVKDLFRSFRKDLHMKLELLRDDNPRNKSFDSILKLYKNFQQIPYQNRRNFAYFAKLYQGGKKNLPFKQICDYSGIQEEELEFLDDLFKSKANKKNFCMFMKIKYLKDLLLTFLQENLAQVLLDRKSHSKDNSTYDQTDSEEDIIGANNIKQGISRRQSKTKRKQSKKETVYVHSDTSLEISENSSTSTSHPKPWDLDDMIRLHFELSKYYLPERNFWPQELQFITTIPFKVPNKGRPKH
ncbi:hypothetical protein FGO68_gene8625 [Halteria grandinella]|uniref:Uncharacterized protein n=1 Tax=Halteria grandinella TaxID=5974 RepID=A0A8J8T2B6_HALGN|nr:hypothetical protein FGO68_gene8625 [Halteria grandinella]